MIVQILEEAMSYDDLSQWAELQTLTGYDAVLTVKESVATVMLEKKGDSKKVLAKIETPLEDGKTPEEKKKVIKATTVADDEGLKDIEVNVIGSHYIYNHGKKPTGKGKWAFGVGSRDAKDLIFFDGAYSQVSRDAVLAAKKKAKKEGKATVKLYVMESSMETYNFETVVEGNSKLFSGKAKVNGKEIASITGINESVVEQKTAAIFESLVMQYLEKRSLSKKEEKKKEKVVKGIKSSAKDMKSRYGKDWKSVAYGAATNIAKKGSKKIVEAKTLAEDVQTFEIEYEMQSEDGKSTGTTKYKATNSGEARTRFMKDHQGKKVVVRSVKPVNESLAESTELSMDVHDLTDLIMREAIKAAKAKIGARDSEGDEFDLDTDLEDAVGDYLDLVVHHLEDNRAELTNPEKIKSYLGEDYESGQYGESKDEVIDSLISKYLDGEDSESIRTALSDAFEAGAEIGATKSDDISSDVNPEELTDEPLVKEAERERSEYTANLHLSKNGKNIPSKEFSDFSEWQKFLKRIAPAVQFAKKAVVGGDIVVAKDAGEVLGSYSEKNGFGFIGEDCEKLMEQRLSECKKSSNVSAYAELIASAKDKF